MKNEICVPLAALSEGGETGESIAPEMGDNVPISGGSATVTRIEGDKAYLTVNEINGQQVVADEAPMDDGAEPTPEQDDARLTQIRGGKPANLYALALAALLLGLLVWGSGEPQDAQAQNALVQTRQLLKTNSSTTLPVALGIDGTYFRTATLIGNNDNARTANTGNVWIGATTNNNAQPFLISSGQTITIEAPVGEWYDLNDWYLDVATANDGVVIILTY